MVRVCQTVPEKRELHRKKNSGNVRRVTLEYLAEETTKVQGKNHLNG